MSSPGRHAARALFVALASSVGAQAEEGWRLGPGAQVRRPGFELRLNGYVQEDFRRFGDSFTNERGERPLLAEETELRRTRIGFEATWKRLEVQLQLDPADDVAVLKDAYAELKLAKALRVRAGNFKVPVSDEHLRSAAKTDFVERAMLASEMAPARDVGVALLGEPAKFLFYEVGVFAGDARSDPRRAETTVAGRVVVSPASNFDVGLSFSDGNVEAEPEGPSGEVSPKGFSGRGPSGFAFSVRRFVDGRRRRMGADLRFTPGPLGFGGEILRGTEERRGQGGVVRDGVIVPDDLPDEVALGWAVSATWLVTGEAKKRTIEPARGLHRGGIGAVELGVRYESMRYDDDGPDSGFAGAGSRSRNITPVGNRVLTGGVSWWPVYWVRLMGNVALERFDEPLFAPVPGKQGSYVTLLGRVQLSVP